MRQTALALFSAKAETSGPAYLVLKESVQLLEAGMRERGTGWKRKFFSTTISSLCSLLSEMKLCV